MALNVFTLTTFWSFKKSKHDTSFFKINKKKKLKSHHLPGNLGQTTFESFSKFQRCLSYGLLGIFQETPFPKYPNHQFHLFFLFLLLLANSMGTPAFPNLGKHCSVEDCRQIDFLPFTCDCCHKVPFFLFYGCLCVILC